MDIIDIIDGFRFLIGFLWRNRLKVVLGLVTVAFVAWLVQQTLDLFGSGQASYWAVFFAVLVLAIVLATVFWFLRTLLSMLAGLFRRR